MSTTRPAPLSMGTKVEPDVIWSAIDRALERGFSVDDLTLRVGFEAYVELVYLCNGEIEDELANAHPLVAAARTQRRRDRESRIRAQLKGWTKSGAQLYGVRLVQAERFGWELRSRLDAGSRD